MTSNSKQKEGLTKLIDEYRNIDHWVGLDNIRDLAHAAADNIDVIANDFENISTNRKELPQHLVRLMALIEICKVKLSIMPQEWNDTVDKVIEEMLKEVPKPELEEAPNFDDMEF